MDRRSCNVTSSYPIPGPCAWLPPISSDMIEEKLRLQVVAYLFRCISQSHPSYSGISFHGCLCPIWRLIQTHRQPKVTMSFFQRAWRIARERGLKIASTAVVIIAATIVIVIVIVITIAHCALRIAHCAWRLALCAWRLAVLLAVALRPSRIDGPRSSFVARLSSTSFERVTNHEWLDVSCKP
jgi:hypothetical protein